ncbi:hypothetical protein ACFFX0_30080 [Citricoccus parietis]|uniref:Uncharacterized protein n=1 Tax=Citricoccus parietis TaxID=592307 RepID=A0ABV5G8A2_9MICC
MWRRVEGSLAELPSEQLHAGTPEEFPGDELSQRRTRRKSAS